METLHILGGLCFLLAILYGLYQHYALPPVAAFDGRDDRQKGPEFERYCADLLRRNGFHDVRVCGRSGDGGVDVLARKGWRLYAIQCKCYSHPVDVKAVQEINAGMEKYNANIGVVMTNNRFTRAAIKAAQDYGRDRPIWLWDRHKLESMRR